LFCILLIMRRTCLIYLSPVIGIDILYANCPLTPGLGNKLFIYLFIFYSFCHTHIRYTFQTFQLSRFYRESPENSCNLPVSRFLSNSPDFSEYSGNIIKNYKYTVFSNIIVCLDLFEVALWQFIGSLITT
jgi:hypothetical protein